MRFWALLFLFCGCGDNEKSARFCGVNACGDLQAPTVAQCLLDSFVRCTPAKGAIVVNGELITYEIDANCTIVVAKSTSYEVCVGLSYTSLIDPTKCPWLVPAGCGPMIARTQ